MDGNPGRKRPKCEFSDQSENRSKINSDSARKRRKREFSDQSENRTDILGGLCDDIVLGEVVPQFPWYKRPALAPLSRWWAHAMTHTFPYYARLQNPRILSNSLVFFHTPSLEYPEYNALCIWLYNDDEGTLRNFPVPAVPEESRSHVKFVRDDNDERIYSFTHLRRDGQIAHDVSVVDLRDGNVRWKKLPQLPAVQVVLSCSSSDNGGRCTTYHILWVPRNLHELQEDDFSVCTLHARNDIPETQSQFQFQWQPELGDTRDDLVNKLFGYVTEDAHPTYLEISLPLTFDGKTPKCIYATCDPNKYNTVFSIGLETPEYLLMQFENDRRLEQESSNSCNATLYYMTAFDEAGIREVNIFKLKLDDENCWNIEEESEWDAFWDNLIPVFPERVEGKATKVSSQNFLEWEKRTFNIEQVVDIDKIKVAPKSVRHVYSLVTVVWI